MTKHCLVVLFALLFIPTFTIAQDVDIIKGELIFL